MKTVFAAAALLAALSACAPARAQQIWLAPKAPYDPSVPAPEWDALFAPDAGSEWPVAAAHTAVVTWNIEHQEGWPAAKLAAESAWIHAHGMKLAVTLMSLESRAGCASGEGFAAPGTGRAVAARLKRAGAQVDILQMDGPLNFGSYVPGLCRWPVWQAAAAAAASLNGYLAAFPAAEVADIESAPVLTAHPGFAGDYAAFMAGVQAATGRRISRIAFDTDWTAPAIQTELPRLRDFAHANRMRFGVFYNGTGNDPTDQAWMADATASIAMAEGRLGVIPDDANIATWNPSPSNLLPDSDPLSLTGLVRAYALPRAQLQMSLSGAVLTGRLTDQTGAGVPNAAVSISRLGADPAQRPPVRALTAQAPLNARYGILGWRVNVECNCSGPNDLLLGDLTYAETSGGQVRSTLSLPTIAAQQRGNIGAPQPAAVLAMGGLNIVHFKVAADQRFGWTTGSFPITPGARYALTAPIGTVDGAGMYGHAVVVFLDAQKNGIQVRNLIAPATVVQKAGPTTDPQGRFSATAASVTGGAAIGVQADYAGSAALRPTQTRLLP